jgi:uncharacterized protein
MPPWYKQFWPWFLIAFPATAVIAGIATLLIATADPDGLVVSDYYKAGLAINRDFERQRRAEAMGLNARLELDPETGNVRLRLEGDTANGILDVTWVRLWLVHPTRAHRDLQAELYRDLSGALSGPVGFPGEGYWRVVVEPEDGSWRLTGRLALPERTEVRLLPG